MLLNRYNLELAKLATADESRYSINSIYVTPTDTVVTDGHQLTIISAPAMPEENFPVIEGFEPCDKEFEPFLIDRKSALELAAAIPKTPNLPALEHVRIGTEVTDGFDRTALRFATTDLERARILQVRKPAGQFPDYTKVMPDHRNAKCSFYMNPALLETILGVFKRFAQRDNLKSVLFTYYDGDQAIRLDAENVETGQRMTAVVMPLKDNLQARDFHPRPEEQAEASAEAIAESEKPMEEPGAAALPAVEANEESAAPPVPDPARQAKTSSNFEKTGTCPGCSHENIALALCRGFRIRDGKWKFFNGYICEACASGEGYKVKRVTAEDFKTRRKVA